MATGKYVTSTEYSQLVSGDASIPVAFDILVVDASRLLDSRIGVWDVSDLVNGAVFQVADDGSATTFVAPTELTARQINAIQRWTAQALQYMAAQNGQLGATQEVTLGRYTRRSASGQADQLGSAQFRSAMYYVDQQLLTAGVVRRHRSTRLYLEQCDIGPC